MRHAAPVLAATLLIAACADDGPGTTIGTDTGGTADVADVSVGDDVDAADDVAADDASEDVAIDFTPDPACTSDWLVVVRGSAVDDEGAAVVDASAQLCVRIGSPEGNLVCLRPEPTNEAGEFRVVAPQSARCVGGGTMHLYDYDGTVAPMYCHIETENEGGTLELDDPFVLFETDAVEELPPWGEPTEPRAITFPGGLEIAQFVPHALGFLFGEAEYANLGARRVDPDAEGLCFLTTAVDALWAFRVEADVKGTFGIRMPNELGYAPGATVGLYILGGIETTLPGGVNVAETEWKRYAAGTVTEDGAWIVGELPAFTWFGYVLED